MEIILDSKQIPPENFSPGSPQWFERRFSRAGLLTKIGKLSVEFFLLDIHGYPIYDCYVYFYLLLLLSVLELILLLPVLFLLFVLLLHCCIIVLLHSCIPAWYDCIIALLHYCIFVIVLLYYLYYRIVCIVVLSYCGIIVWLTYYIIVIIHPVVRGEGCGALVFFFPLSNGEPRSLWEFPSHMIVGINYYSIATSIASIILQLSTILGGSSYYRSYYLFFFLYFLLSENDVPKKINRGFSRFFRTKLWPQCDMTRWMILG